MKDPRDEDLSRWFAQQPRPNAAEDFTKQLQPRLQHEKTRSHLRRWLAALLAVLALALITPVIETITLLLADAVVKVSETPLAIDIREGL